MLLLFTTNPKKNSKQIEGFRAFEVSTLSEWFLLFSNLSVLKIVQSGPNYHLAIMDGSSVSQSSPSTLYSAVPAARTRALIDPLVALHGPRWYDPSSPHT